MMTRRPRPRIRFHRLPAIPAALIVLATGCASMRDSTPIRDAVAHRGVTLTRSLPDKLPGNTSPVPNAQYVLVNADSAIVALADLANPVPFVDDFAMSKWNERKAAHFKDHITRVDPYGIAVERMAGSPLLSGQPDALHLMPFVYMMECGDQRYRLTLVFRVEGKDWLGRYLYHLPTTYTVAEMKSDAPLPIDTLRAELVAGCDRLRDLMERDARGEWMKPGPGVEFGSDYLVGARIMGLLPAHLFTYKDAELLEEGRDHVVLRSRGDLSAAGNAGALAFGVHYFRKDQLHTFNKKKTTP